MRLFAMLTTAMLAPVSAMGVEYECLVDRKVDSERVYPAADLKKLKFSVRIEDEGATGAAIHRCSFSGSQGKVTCDRYEVDKVTVDQVARLEADPDSPLGHRFAGLFDKIKKFYIFRGQFDVQLFPDLAFIENNGRGSIAFGKCRPLSP